MNRIILIGNGFDLAHGLPTRYEDFINWYWKQWCERLVCSSNKVESDVFCSFSLKDNVGLGGWYLVWQWRYQCHPIQENYRELIDIVKNDHDGCEFKSNSIFFSRICKVIESKGWVDIENEYYDLLREVVIKPENCNYAISELNSHLYYIQKLLTQYLSSITSAGISCDKRIIHQIFEKIHKDDICISQMQVYNDYVNYLIYQDNVYSRLLCRYGFEGPDKHFKEEDINRLKRQFSESSEIEEIYLKDLILPENILILSFNYTDIGDNYITSSAVTINHIHGDLPNPNGMIFGYGDEFDDDYKDLLKQTDKECLKNIKSIRYLESNNYRNMLQFIESAPYQVYVMGHSCGNSDRTLLNTLFEHKNCVSIKPYYYQKEDGSDNYMEIVQNICRNFTDMKLMRDRVVNKTFCEPLPQSNPK